MGSGVRTLAAAYNHTASQSPWAVLWLPGPSLRGSLRAPAPRPPPARGTALGSAAGLLAGDARGGHCGGLGRGREVARAVGQVA